MIEKRHKTLPLFLGAVVIAGGIALGACGGSSSTGTATGGGATNTKPASGAAQVLPVTKDPISNTSTIQAMKITSFLVDNNVDAKNQPVADHLEIAVKNTGATTLSQFEVFYTFTDAKTKSSENYYTKLPDSFTIPAGGTRTIHFDNTGSTDHFPVNKYSLYYTAKNPLDVHVMVSANGAAVQSVTAKKTPSTGENANQ